MSQPVGMLCPACHQPAVMAFAQQAFCGRSDCKVMTWNPTLTLDENLDAMEVIDLPEGI